MQDSKKRVIFNVADERIVKVVKDTVVEHYGVRAYKTLFDGKVLLSTIAKRRELFLISKEQYEIYERLKSKGRDPYFIGIFVGMVRVEERIRYRPSLDLFEKLFKVSRRNAVIVTEKSMENVLYGKDVLLEGIIDTINPIGKYPLVISTRMEPIALGITLRDPKRWKGLEPKTVVIKTIMDKGRYLRSGI